MSVLKEFREFAVKGNVVDMAVGIIIGAAFGKIVSSLVSDVVTPPLGYLIGRMLVVALFLPHYFRGEMFSAYEVLNRRFGGSVRQAASLLFLVTRTFADGLRLYLTAIPVKIVTGMNLSRRWPSSERRPSPTPASEASSPSSGPTACNSGRISSEP